MFSFICYPFFNLYRGVLYILSVLCMHLIFESRLYLTCMQGLFITFVSANMVADGCTHGDIRLVGGATSAEGRLEVCVNSIWGTVCGSYSWGADEATVACKQLGYSGKY